MNTELIQSIYRIVVNGVDSKWKVIEFRYKIDDTQSEYQGSYKTEDDKGYFNPDGLSREERNELSDLLLLLRSKMGETSGELFTHCILKFESDGNFNIDVSYGPVDWSVMAD